MTAPPLVGCVVWSLNFDLVYGVGVCVNVCGVVCVVVCCLFLMSGCCLLCCDIVGVWDVVIFVFMGSGVFCRVDVVGLCLLCTQLLS